MYTHTLNISRQTTITIVQQIEHGTCYGCCCCCCILYSNNAKVFYVIRRERKRTQKQKDSIAISRILASHTYRAHTHSAHINSRHSISNQWLLIVSQQQMPLCPRLLCLHGVQLVSIRSYLLTKMNNKFVWAIFLCRSLFFPFLSPSLSILFLLAASILDAKHKFQQFRSTSAHNHSVDCMR